VKISDRYKWAWSQDTDPTSLLVLLCLVDHCNATSGRCNPSLETIAKHTKLSERTVRRAVTRLEAEGLLIVTKPHLRAVSYDIPLDRPASDSVSQPLRTLCHCPSDSLSQPALDSVTKASDSVSLPLDSVSSRGTKDPEPVRTGKGEVGAPAGADALTSPPSAANEQATATATANDDPPSRPSLPLRPSGATSPDDTNGQPPPPLAPAAARPPAPTLTLATPEQMQQRIPDRRHTAADLPQLTGPLDFAGQPPRPVLDTLPLPQDEQAWRMCTGRRAGSHAEGDPHSLLPKLRWSDPKQTTDWRRLLRILADRGAYRLWHAAMREAWTAEKPPSWEDGMKLARQVQAQLDQDRRQHLRQVEEEAVYEQMRAEAAGKRQREEAERQLAWAEYHERHRDDPEVRDGE